LHTLSKTDIISNTFIRIKIDLFVRKKDYIMIS
jgi:hypothetical protein